METGAAWYRSCRARYSDSSSGLSPYPAAAENTPRGRLAGTALLRLLLVGGLVLLVGDWFEPGGAVSSGDALEHGEVAHEVADGGAVPVFLAWGGVGGVAGVHADDCAVAGLHEPDAVGDVQGLNRPAFCGGSQSTGEW